MEHGKSRVTFQVDYLDASRVWLLQQGMHGELAIFPELPFQGSDPYFARMESKMFVVLHP